MLRAILLRLAGAIPVLFLVACGIFSLLHLAPGDAAALLSSTDAGPEDVERLRALWGLDQPLYVQFGKFLLNVAQLNLGTSLRYQQPVVTMIAERLPATLELAAVTLIIAVCVGVPLGIAAALHKGKLIDGLVSMIAVAGVSAPSFWMGILLVLLFSADLHILPSSGRLPYGTPIADSTGFYLIDSLIARDWETFRSAVNQLILPALTLAIFSLAPIARMTRASMLAVLSSDFVRTARASGLSPGTVIVTYAFRNAMLPVITTLSMVFSFLLGANVLVEKVFAWPGIGSYAVEALISSDFAPVQGFVLTMAVLYVALNLLIDMMYGVIDPRVRLEG